ncbi:GTPase [Glycomyces harbinensis]|uniref:50S ribosome-binding GTPase n=1 Tax=Glycomyces harbinensis TaxID=58114 RepID=A0A1G6R3P5_9ACTN|nr:GTPase [Glycomyces harbinensis]SDC99141.1 50S ribosome-binding GTPase [Glycomyces harbinensis]
MHSEADDHGLAAAISEAMAGSAPQARSMVERLDRIAAALQHSMRRQAADAAIPESGSRRQRARADSMQALAAAEYESASSVAAGLQSISHRLNVAAAKFNIVLFGRTGAGKSTLIEALTHGDGASISPGRSDHTDVVRHVFWNDCVLHDTPGTLGSGREGVTTDFLERQAHEAVLIADVVLLCFDSQNQTQGEFAQVAEWIAAYGKPAVAILNVRNKGWRNPRKVTSRGDRRDLSVAVEQHVRRIRQELRATGLASTPVVAINAQFAAFARAGEAYAGPFTATRSGMLKMHGAAKIDAWSNVPALESLLTRAVRTDAAGLRLGMLRGQVRSTLDQAADVLDAEIVRPASAYAADLERAVDQSVEVLGLPASGDPGGLRPALARMNELRGRAGPAAPIPGRVEPYARHQLKIVLGGLQDEANENAYRLVQAAIRDRSDIGEAAFEAGVYGALDLDTVVRDLNAKIKEFLRENLDIIDKGLAADLDLTRRTLRLEGAAGKRLIGVGNVSGVIGSAALVGGLTLAVGALAVGGPLVIPVLLVGAGVAGRISGMLLKRRGKRLFDEKTGDLVAQARLSVDATFDKLRRDVHNEIDTLLETLRNTTVLPRIRRAVEFRELGSRVARLRELLVRERDEVPATGPVPQELLAAAVAACETATGRTSGQLWLGEDWCDDPDFLRPDGEEGEVVLAKTPRPSSMSRLLLRLRSAPQFRTAQRHPRLGAGRKWMREVAAAAEALADPELTALQGELAGLMSDRNPTVVLCGDYSTGKTSFIRRLMLEAGRLPGDGLEVAAQPLTDKVTGWEMDGFTLVDTPGLRSGSREHTAAALTAVRRATMILYLLNPTFAHGENTDLDEVLGTGDDAAEPGRIDRVLFVLNRVDEIGPDPFYNEGEFAKAIGEKRDAFLELLKRRGHTVPPERVHHAISAPSGMLLTRPDQIAPYRAWDGIAEVLGTITTSVKALERNGPDAAVLHTGHHSLAGLLAGARARRHRAERTVRELDLLERTARQQVTAAAHLRWAQIAELRSAVRLHLEKRFDRIRNAPVAAARKEAETLRDWARNPAVVDLVNAWFMATDEQIGQWNRHSTENMRAEFGRRAFREALPDAEFPASMTGLKWGRGRTPIGRVGRILQDPLAGVVIGGAIGVLVTGVVDAAEPLAERKRAKKRDPLFEQARAELAYSGELWVDRLLDPSREDAGPAAELIAELDRNAGALAAWADLRRREREEAQRQIDVDGARIAQYEDLLEKARKALRTPKD